MDPTEKIEQAVLAARWGDAEDTIEKILSKITGVEVKKINILADALFYLRASTHETLEGVEREVSEAIRASVLQELRKKHIRQAMAAKEKIRVKYADLYERKPPNAVVCRGCEHSIPCAANDLSTPQQCWRSGFVSSAFVYKSGSASITRRRDRTLLATPVKIIDGQKLEIVTDHPPGSWVIDIDKVPLP